MAATEDHESAKQRLKDMFRRLDMHGTGCVSRGPLWSILAGVGIDNATAQATLDSADTKKDGRIDIELFFDWLFATPEARRDMMTGADSDAGKVKDGGPLFVGTLNFLGNAYNALEFLNTDKVFLEEYHKVRESFAELTCKEVLDETLKLGFNPDKINEALKAEPEDKFEKVCTKEFLSRDNKLDLILRTNMIVAGMMPTQRGPPLFHDVKEWRTHMKGQIENYEKDPPIALWDVACNLAAEHSAEVYIKLCSKSYLNPELILRNVQTLLSKLPTGQEVVCAVQEFPEKDTAKNMALLGELPRCGMKFVRPDEENSSVGFIISAGIQVENIQHAPLGSDPEKVYKKIYENMDGMTDYENIDKKDKESLKTTVYKTFVMDVAAARHRGPMRFVSVHAKEFKTEDGTKLLAAYLRALAGDVKDRVAFVLLDSNTPNKKKSQIFDEALTANGFSVLSPASAEYMTTRKKRSEMHGQIYDRAKCLQVVSAHKTFAAMVQGDSSAPVWEPKWETLDDGRQRAAIPWPDLKNEGEGDELLPNVRWPTDHCMLRVNVNYKGPKA